MWSILSIAPLFVALARDRLVACRQPAVATGDQTDISGWATALPLSVAEAALLQLALETQVASGRE